MMDEPDMIVLLRYWVEHPGLREQMEKSSADFDIQVQRANAWMREHNTAAVSTDSAFELAATRYGRDIAMYGMDSDMVAWFDRKIAALEAKHAGDVQP